MNKLLPVFTFLIFLCVTALADSFTYKLPDLRKEYLKASKGEAEGERFYEKMKAYKGKDPVVLAYKAASEAVMAKYAWNPYHKLKHIKTSAKIFEEAVDIDDRQPEIRFLRFTVEYYVPRYLNLSGHLEEDKGVVIDSLKKHPASGVSAPLARTMRNFFLSNDHCSEEEKKELKSLAI